MIFDVTNLNVVDWTNIKFEMMNRILTGVFKSLSL